MKKLLMLVMVLGMVATANAALVGTLTGDSNPGAGNVTMSITTYTVPDIDGYMVIAIQGAGALTSALGAAAPTDAAFVDTTGNTGFQELLGAGDIYNMISYTSTYPSGAYINASYTGAVAGDIITAWASIDTTEWVQVGQIIIPEPATIALISLGGLLLRKKK